MSISAIGGVSGSRQAHINMADYSIYFTNDIVVPRFAALDGIAGWPVAVPLERYRQGTFLETIRQARALRVTVVEGTSTQQVSAEIRKPLDARLTPQEVQAVAAALKTSGVQLRVYAVPAIVLMLTGPGRFALDALFARSRPRGERAVDRAA